MKWPSIGIVKEVLLLFCVVLVSQEFPTTDAQAIPAFARKYDVNCTVCHTRVPRLNRTGERFLENGYQLPGTEDGDTIKKSRLGDLTLDDVTNYLGFRLRGNILRTTDYARHASGTNTDGNPEDRTELGFPEVFSLFTAGTVTNNVGFFAEVESNLEEDETGVERAFLTFNNIGQHDWAHLRIGKFDPSAYSFYATLRQQFELVGGNSLNNGSFMLPTINRIGLTPAAFASKFSSLFDRDGTTILPTAPSLFHAILHNTHIRTETRAFFNVMLLPQSKGIKKVMRQPGLMTISCNKHPFMIGYIHVFDHLYFAITDPQGAFTIPNLPPGTHRLAIWHKTLGTIHQTITIPPKNNSVLNIEFTTR